MVHLPATAAVLILSLAASPLASQSIDLTRAPSATIGETFSQIGAVREVPGGLAIATDQIDRRIVLIDFARGSVRQVGRQGDGPGEYRYPMKPFLGTAGSTLVMDAALARILVIAPTGQVTATLKKPVNANVGELMELRGMDARGFLYFETNSFNSESGGFSDTVAIVRVDAKGADARVVARISSGGRVRITTATGAASLTRSITPFPKVDAWEPLPNGIVAMVVQDPYRVDIVDVTGARHVGAAIPYTAIPVTATERKAWQDSAGHTRSSATIKGGGVGPSGPGVTFPDDAFPKLMPAFIAALVRVTPEGTIWVGRSHAIAETSLIYDIFDGTGKRIGSARLKPHSTVVGFGAASVYVARQDPSTDLIHLEKYVVR
jgi:hypothetical protein